MYPILPDTKMKKLLLAATLVFFATLAAHAQSKEADKAEMHEGKAEMKSGVKKTANATGNEVDRGAHKTKAAVKRGARKTKAAANDAAADVKQDLK